MTRTHSRLNDIDYAETPARELLERLWYTCALRDVLVTEA